MSSTIPPVEHLVREIAHNGQYYDIEELATSGLIRSPRAVATIAAAGHDDVIERLVICDPEFGIAAVYGCICCGDQNQLFYAPYGMMGALFASVEPAELREPGTVVPVFSDDFFRLAVYAIRRALEARKPIGRTEACVQEEYRKLARRFDSFPSAVKSAVGVGPVDPSIEKAFPRFATCKAHVDTIRHAMVTGSLPGNEFFVDADRVTENYLKAAYMCTTPRGGALRKRGLEYLERVDPPLAAFFIEGILTGYTGQSIIP